MCIAGDCRSLFGTVLLGFGFMLAGSIPFFVAILLSQIIGGAGYTFLSGAAQAWIADETSEVLASKAYMRGAQVSQVCALIGIVVSTGLAHLQLNLPTIVGGGRSHFRSGWPYSISPCSHDCRGSTLVSSVANFCANDTQMQVRWPITRNLLWDLAVGRMHYPAVSRADPCGGFNPLQD